MRFVKGGVARAGCRRRGRAGGNRSGAADLAAVLVTCHRRGVAGRWRRVGEKIALEDDRLDAVIAKLELSVDDAGRRAGPRCSSSPHDRTANGVSMVSWLRGRGAGSRRSTTWWWWATDGRRTGATTAADGRGRPTSRGHHRSPSALGERAPVDHTPRVVPHRGGGRAWVGMRGQPVSPPRTRGRAAGLRRATRNGPRRSAIEAIRRATRLAALSP